MRRTHLTGKLNRSTILWWLVGASLLIHLLALEWLVRSQRSLDALAVMGDPEFNQALLPSQGVADDTASAEHTARATALNLPPPTVGQVVQARTLLATPPEATPPAAEPPKHPPTPPAVRPPRPQSPPAPATPAPPAQPTAPTPPEPTPPEPNQPGPATIATQAPAPSADPRQPEEARPPGTAAAPAPAAVQPHTAPPAPLTPPPAEHQQAAAQPDPAQPPTATSGSQHTEWLQAWPANTRLNYSLIGYYRGDVYGDARVQWQRTGEQYQAQVNVTLGLLVNIRFTSQGRITPTRLWPDVYEETRLGKLRSIRMGQQQVTLDNGSTLPRPAQLQDTASQFVQLSQDFASGRLPLKVGAVIPVALARPGGIDDWVYDVVALDTLATPLGELPAYHLKPRPLANPRNSISTEMWFAPSLQHLPVRIRMALNADTWLDLTVKEVTQTAR